MTANDLMTTKKARERAFARVSLFKALTTRQRARLAAHATTHSYPAGSIILRQGDTSMALYVVLSGAVRVERDVDSLHHVALGELYSGAIFGEMGLIDDAVRSATVVALKHTECALLSKWDFEKLLRDHAEITLALLRMLAARLRRLEASLPSQTLEATTADAM